jgi:xanthine/CO dehydrogenase XdhC/CoxF family maturation factor
MKEFVEILDAIARTEGAIVLATLVSVQGSTYRRPGARMLVVDGERRVGTISGGCLEAEVCRQAKEMTANSPPRVITFNTLDDDDVVLGYSLGCKGVIKVLLQSIAPRHRSPVMMQIEECLKAGESAALATVYGVEGDAEMTIGAQVLLSGGKIFGDVSPQLAALMSSDLRDVVASGRWRNRICELTDGGRAEIFVEPIVPTIRLLIFGGGADAVPLANIAKNLGWRITLIDPRPRDTIAARFPIADQIVESAPRAAVAELSFDMRTAAVIMTHNYGYDAALLASMLPNAAIPYIGLLGPRHRTQRLLSELAEQGVTPTPEQLPRLYTPAGLDIGTNTPEEIALAIVAEIQTVLSRRPGGHLRDRAGDIHG